MDFSLTGICFVIFIFKAKKFINFTFIFIFNV